MEKVCSDMNKLFYMCTHHISRWRIEFLKLERDGWNRREIGTEEMEREREKERRGGGGGMDLCNKFFYDGI